MKLNKLLPLLGTDFPRHCLLALVLVAMFLFPRLADAQISVNDVIVHFKHGERPIQNVIVRNSSAETMYVTVTAETIDNPADDKSKSSPAKDLLVSPQNFSVEGNGERAIRILLRKPPDDTEKVYRVVFVPQDRAFGETVDHKSNGRQAVLRVLTGMGLLVFADPNKPKAALTWKRESGKVTFRNDGNLHVRLLDGKACTAPNENCTDLPSKRIYGGTSFVVSAPDHKSLFYTKREGASGSFEQLVVPPRN